jgi:transposase
MKVVEKQKLVDEVAGETEGARRASGVFPAGAPAPEPPVAPAAETEVVGKAHRRRFTAEYKRRIMREADRCTTAGAIGALLRREGLYSSHLTTWRAARDRGELEGLAPKKRGPKALPPDPRDKKIAEQEREIGTWRKRAERAEALVEVQKKVAALLGTPFDSEPS